MSRSKVRQGRVKPSFAEDDEEEEETGMAAFLASRKGVQGKAGSKKGAGSTQPAPAAKQKSSIVLKPPAARPEAASAQSTQRSAPGEYSKDRLRELQQKTARLPASKPAAPADPAPFKISGSFKPAGTPKDDRFLAVPSASATRPSDDAPLPPPARPGRTAASVAPAKPQDDDAVDLEGFQAPDEATIRRIKEKRARLQGVHMAPDYVPLGGMTAPLTTDAALRPANGAAAAPAASGSDSEPEQEETLHMTFLGDAHKRGKARPGVFSSLADEDQAEPVDHDEDEAWVNEQIRKGVGRRAEPSPALAAAQQRNKAGGSRGSSREAQPPAAPAAGPGAWASLSARQAEGVATAGDGVIKALQNGVAQLQATQQHAQRSLARTSLNLSDTLKAIDTLEQELEAAGVKYTQMQELKVYIADLCDMLQAKSPIVEELQDHLLKVQQDRADAAVDRTAADDREELAPAEAGMQAALGVLSRGGAEAAAGAAAEKAAAAAWQHMLANLPQKLDEFGRDENMELRDKMVRRHEQRQAAGQQKQHWQPGETAEPHLGSDTSDEDEGEVRHYKRRRADILEASASVFSDAAEAYGSLPAVRARLERWKREQAASYRDAHLSLSVPALLAPFVRLQLLQWDPLFGGQAGLDSQGWYQELFTFGAPQEAARHQQADADEELIPRLVQELALPLATHAVQHVWNPFSRRSTKALAAVLEEMMVYAPADNSKLQATFARRRFGRTLRLLSSIVALQAVLDPSFVMELALKQLVSLVLVPYVRSGVSVPALAVDRIDCIGCLPMLKRSGTSNWH
eukprot:jgi/Astpho2/170/Aster-x0896